MSTRHRIYDFNHGPPPRGGIQWFIAIAGCTTSAHLELDELVFAAGSSISSSK